MSDRQDSDISQAPWYSEKLVYEDIPTAPRKDIGLILVTGAGGYVGGRLVPQLVSRGYRVRIMVRRGTPAVKASWKGAEIVVGDALKKEHLNWALEGVDTAYYLIHSLLLGQTRSAEADIRAAVNFREAAREEGVGRIIYLGGLGDRHANLSPHLRSRIQVADELKAPVPVTVLRAAVVIGSGSASYEIIHHLVKRLPVIPMPSWADNRCQPIGIRDLIKYLVGVLEVPETTGRTFDAGGKEVLTYRDMMEACADVMKNRVYFPPSPLAHIGFYSYLTSLLTPVPAAMAAGLLGGVRDEAVCLDDKIRQYVPFEPLSYREAIVRALTREEQDKVHTRWSDSYPPAHELAMKLYELKDAPCYGAHHTLMTEKGSDDLFRSVCKIGGATGWFNTNWMWRLRGGLDRLLMGVGSARGRKSLSNLEINDVIDFWRVEDIQPSRRLLLRAEMKLPGKAWLEFLIDDEGERRKLSIHAHFHTDTLFGKCYWYFFKPFHNVIFDDLLEQIALKA